MMYRTLLLCCFNGDTSLIISFTFVKLFCSIAISHSYSHPLYCTGWWYSTNTSKLRGPTQSSRAAPGSWSQPWPTGHGEDRKAVCMQTWLMRDVMSSVQWTVVKFPPILVCSGKLNWQLTFMISSTLMQHERSKCLIWTLNVVPYQSPSSDVTRRM